MARTQAALTAAKSRVAYTASELERAQKLVADNAIARREFEEKENAAREAQANLQGAAAALDAAKLNLEYTRIVAPVAGRVSRAEITVGNVVATGGAAPVLTTLVSVSPMYVAFDADEQTYLRFSANTAQGARTPVYIGLANEDGYTREGTIQSVDNRLDVRSGTIRVRATVDNADGRLTPGLYARVKMGSGAPHDAVLISDKAIGTDQDKKFVLVVDAANKTSYRPVTLGASTDGLRVVKAGLKVGERIVVNGIQRVRPGDPWPQRGDHGKPGGQARGTPRHAAAARCRQHRRSCRAVVRRRPGRQGRAAASPRTPRPPPRNASRPTVPDRARTAEPHRPTP